MLRAATIGLALLLGGACAASGQQIRGHVTDAVSGRPVWGALVSALDDQDDVLATALSDSAGRFGLTANGSGPVRLRVERLAYERLETVPLSFAEGDAPELELRLTPRPIAVPEVRAAGAPFPGIQQDVAGPGILGRSAYTITPGLRGPRSATLPEARRLGCHPWVYETGTAPLCWCGPMSASAFASTAMQPGELAFSRSVVADAITIPTKELGTCSSVRHCCSV